MVISDINKISSKEDFMSFLGGLAENFRDKPNEWQALTVDLFLEACASWIMDFAVCPKIDIDWNSVDYKTFAKILFMGKYYE